MKIYMNKFIAKKRINLYLSLIKQLIIKILMKTLLILVLMASSVMGCYIKVDPTYYVKNYDFGLDLACTPATGNITYNVVGLPDGLLFDGKRFKVSEKGCKSGYYPVQVTARDGNNYADKKMILFVLNDLPSKIYQASSNSEQYGTTKYQYISSTQSSTGKISSSQNLIPKIQFYQGSTGIQFGNSQSSSNDKNWISSSSSSSSGDFANNLSNSLDSAISNIQSKQSSEYKAKLEAISVQIKSIQSQITEKQSLITSVQQNIQKTTISIQQTQKKVTELSSKFEVYSKSINLITASIKEAEQKKSLLVATLQDKNTEFDSLTKKIQSIKVSVNQIQAKITVLQENLKTKQNEQISNTQAKQKSTQKIVSLKDQISQYEEKIKALKLQLLEEQVQLQTYNEFDTKIPISIQEIKVNLQNYNKKLQSVNYSQQQSSINSLKLQIIPGLKTQITSQESLIVKYQEQLANAKTSFDIASYNTSIETFNQQIVSYKQQIADYNAKIKQYQLSIDTLLIQKQRLTSEYNLLTELNQTNNEIISKTTSSYTNIYGSKYQIDNWSNYLITNYGSSFGFTIPNQINYLYKYDITARYPHKTQLTQTSLCDISGRTTSSYYGYVVDSNDDLFTVSDIDGNKSQVKILGCSSLMTNIANYWPAKGDILIWRGYKQANIWNGLQATCLH